MSFLWIGKAFLSCAAFMFLLFGKGFSWRLFFPAIDGANGKMVGTSQCHWQSSTYDSCICT